MPASTSKAAQHLADFEAAWVLQVETGYLDDEGVPKDSKTPTFAAVAMHIDNDRQAQAAVADSCWVVLDCGEAVC